MRRSHTPEVELHIIQVALVCEILMNALIRYLNHTIPDRGLLLRSVVNKSVLFKSMRQSFHFGENSWKSTPSWGERCVRWWRIRILTRERFLYEHRCRPGSIFYIFNVCSPFTIYQSNKHISFLFTVCSVQKWGRLVLISFAIPLGQRPDPVYQAIVISTGLPLAFHQLRCLD